MSARLALTVALATAALTFGCSRGGRSEPQAGQPLYAPQAWGRAALYLGAAPPEPHRVLGLVQAFGTGVRAKRTDVLHSLRREGQRMGCDAVVDVDVKTDGDRAQAVGVCIQWEDARASL